MLTRTIWLLSIVSLLTDVSSELLYPVMPVYLKSIGFSFFLIGLLEGIAEAVAGLSKGYFGNLSDRMGKRLPFVQVGYALSTLSKGLLALYSTLAPVFIARVCDRLGKGVRTSARDAMLSLETSPKTKASVFGFHRSMDTVGAAIGPLLALIYLYYHPEDYKTLFAIAVIPGIFSVAITFIIKERKFAVENSRKNRPGFFTYLSYWKSAGSSYKTVVAALILFALVNSSDVFLLLAIKEKGFSDIQMIAVYIFYNLVFALIAFPIGKIADRIGLINAILTGLFVFSVVYFFFGFASTLISFAILFLAYSVFAACFEPVAKAIVSNLCAKENTGTALGFFSSMSSIATIVASSWTGFVWMMWGALPAFLVSAAGTMLIIAFLIFNKKKILVS